MCDKEDKIKLYQNRKCNNTQVDKNPYIGIYYCASSKFINAMRYQHFKHYKRVTIEITRARHHIHKVCTC